jgi:hypothetical protein
MSKHENHFDFYSKVKDIYIELHNYSFYHNPEEGSSDNPRFIGRKKQLNRLTSLLTETASKSGAYLITGYRGMGKTSLVNQALASVQNLQSGLISLRRFFRLYAILLLVLLMHDHTIELGTWSLYAWVSVFSISCLHFCFYNNRRKYEDKLWSLEYIWSYIILSLKELPRFDNKAHEEKITKIVAQDICVVALIVLLNLLCYPQFSNLHGFKINNHFAFSHFHFTFLVDLILFVTIAASISKVDKLIDGSNKKTGYDKNDAIGSCLFDFLKTSIYLYYIILYFGKFAMLFSDNFYRFALYFFIFSIFIFIQILYIYYIKSEKLNLKTIWTTIGSQINFGHYVPIRINLGQDELREIDILTMIAKSTHQTYKTWQDQWLYPPKKLFWSITYYGTILLITHIFFYTNPSYQITNQWRNDTHFIEYFPSQALFSNSSNNRIEKFSAFSDSLIVRNRITQLDSYKDYIDFINSKGNTYKVDDYVIIYEKNFVEKSLRGFCIATDMFLHTYYNRVLHFFFGGAPNLGYVAVIDYWYLLYVACFILLFHLLARFAMIVGIRTPRYTLGLLANLIENIDAQVTESASIGTGANPKNFVLFSLGKQRVTPKLDAKAIENQLIFIMDEIDKIPRVAMRPKFIFIFDELDKIEPHYNASIVAKEKEDIDNVKIEGSRMRQELVTRILGNLKHFLNTAKSKFIFIAGREMYDASLADASDREAYISTIFNDVIEVPSFYTDDSDNRSSDITSMIEQYVCRNLIPVQEQAKYETSLSGYNQYLQKVIFKNEEGENKKKREKIMLTLHNFVAFLTYRSNGAPKKVAVQFEKYVIQADSLEVDIQHSTQNLIVHRYKNSLFLKFNEHDQYRFGFHAYLFTPFLMTVGNKVVSMGDKILVSTSFLLDHLYKFHPYAFSWRNLELTPEIIAIDKAPQLRSFITELLSFLSQNHIREIISGLHDFKFNQKIAAEIKYISTISEPDSAAFNFTLDESLQVKRYYKKRLNDLKKNYIGKDLKDTQYIHAISFLHMILGDLHFYDQEYDDAIIQYLDAVQLLRNVKGKDISPGNLILLTRNMLKLGLTFERKRSFESALSYYGAVDTIITGAREVPFESLGLQEYILKRSEINEFVDKFYQDIEGTKMEERIENRIKNEKRGDTAWENNAITDKKDLLVSKILFLEGKDNDGKLIPYISIYGRKSNPVTTETMEIKRNNRLREKEDKTLKTSGSNWKNMSYFHGFTSDIFGEQMMDFSFSPELQTVFLKTSNQEELRLLYQPLIARIQILEKESMQGITKVDIDRADLQFDYLTKTFKKSEKYLIHAEYNNKIGDILFYKNGFLEIKDYEHISEDDKETFYNTINEIEKSFKQNSTLFKPISAYKRYMMGCLNLLKYGFEMSIKSIDFEKDVKRILLQGEKIENEVISKVFDIWENIKIKENKSAAKGYSDNIVSALAYSILDIADCILSFSGNEYGDKNNSKITAQHLYLILKCENKFRKNQLLNNIHDFTDLDQTICFYYLASQLFKSIGNFNAANSQRLKILYLLNDYCSKHDGDFNTKFMFKNPDNEALKNSIIFNIQKKLVEHPIRYSYRMYSNAIRPEIVKINRMFDIELTFDNTYVNIGNSDNYIYREASISADAMEFVLIYETLLFKLGKGELDIEKFMIDAYNVPNKNYNRILGLHLKTKYLYGKVKKLFAAFAALDSVSEKDNRIETVKTKLEELKDTLSVTTIFKYTIDAIYCFSEIINAYEQYGDNYILSFPTAIGRTHKKMAEWCRLLLILEESYPDEAKGFKGDLKKLLGYEDLYFIYSTYHLEKAVECYDRAIRTHTDSRPFSQFLEKMFYLDDDFNDDVLHFNFALERYRINTGSVHSDIKDLVDKQLSDNNLYSLGTYK